MRQKGKSVWRWPDYEDFLLVTFSFVWKVLWFPDAASYRRSQFSVEPISPLFAFTLIFSLCPVIFTECPHLSERPSCNHKVFSFYTVDNVITLRMLNSSSLYM